MKKLTILIICIILASCVFTKRIQTKSNNVLGTSLEQEYLLKYNSDSLQKFCKYPDTSNCLTILLYDSTYFAFVKNKYKNNLRYTPYFPNENYVIHKKKFDNFWYKENKLTFTFYSVKDSIKDGKYLVYKNGDKGSNYLYNKEDTLIALMNIKNGVLDGENYLFFENKRLKNIYLFDNGNLKQIITCNHLGEIYSCNYIFENGMDSIVWFGKKNYEERLYWSSNYSINHNQKAGYETTFYSPIKSKSKNKNNTSEISISYDYYNWNTEEHDYEFYGDCIHICKKNSLDSKNNFNTSLNKYGKVRFINKKPKGWLTIEGKNDSLTYYYKILPYDRISVDSMKNSLKKINDFNNLISIELFLFKPSELFESNCSKFDSTRIYGLKLLPNLNHFQYIENVKIDNPYLKKLPNSIYRTKTIKRLFLRVDNLDLITKNIDKCTNLETLILEGKTTDINSIILRVSKLPNLKNLYLVLKECDRIPSNLYKLHSLEELSLYYPTTNVYSLYTNLLLDSSNLKGLDSLKYLVVDYSNYKHLQKFVGINMPNCYISMLGDGCLAKGTPILQTNNKTKAIENLKVGDILLAYNEQTKIIDTTVVTKTFIHPQHFNNCLNITAKLNGKSILVQATDNHPFYTQEKQWITAGELTLDMHLLIFDATSGKNEFVKISSLTPIKKGLPVVYNIETSKHNYFANGILVHNK